MIEVHRLNGTVFALNAELVEQIESTPDTVITLVTGNNIVVRESRADVVEKIISYRRAVAAEREAALIKG